MSAHTKFEELLARLERLTSQIEDVREGLRRAVPAGRKVLIVLDQFEQWLHARSGQPDTALIPALRQCDGQHVQCLVLVRDDFWLPVSRFMADLGIEILQGQNTALVDLFDPLHARQVLAAFGRSYGRLPDDLDALSSEQASFLTQAVSGLSDGGRVISVRLSLFAEMVKGQLWMPATLKVVGGVEGLGITFLEETFCSASSNPKHRLHQQAARAVLRALLPEPGTDIKGNLRPHHELLERSGYAGRPAEFEALMRILDSEVRLITPADPEGVAGEGQANSGPARRERYYQLTHDYLVPSLREWLTRKQRETRRGRAQLRLEERTAQWTHSREARFLPGPAEFLSVLCFVRRTHLTDAQHALLRAADRFYLLWTGAILLVLSILVGGAGWLWNGTHEQRTLAKLERFLDASPQALGYALDDLRPCHRRAVAKLDRVLADPKLSGQQKLNAALALADFGDPRTEPLLDGVALGTPGLSSRIIGALEPVKAAALAGLRKRFEGSQKPDERARLATAALHLGDPALARRMVALAEDPADRTAFTVGFARWHADTAALITLLEDADAAFRSGLLAALAQVPWDELEPANREPLQSAADRLCRDTPDAATHSAAVCALTKWGQPVPQLPPTPGLPPDHNWLVNSQGLTMIRMPAGTFRMGDDHSDSADERPAHGVTITRDFWLSDREVPVRLFQQFVDETRDAADYPAKERAPGKWTTNERVSPTPDCPAHQVSWYDAVRFCNWLSRKEKLPTCYRPVSVESENETWECELWAGGYRLPTEAEWEYACRAGTETQFAVGNNEKTLGAFAWFGANSESRSWPAGFRLPNAWGLFDMHGNLWEWCQDWYKEEAYFASPGGRDGGSAADAVRDPSGPTEAARRVYRGGGWAYVAGYCRSAFRHAGGPEYRVSRLGFRVAAVPPGGIKSGQASE